MINTPLETFPIQPPEVMELKGLKYKKALKAIEAALRNLEMEDDEFRYFVSGAISVVRDWEEEE